MSDTSDRIQELIDRPTESLAIELKQWIDPNSQEGKAKIVKACLAIRNYNGGYIVIGFNDKSREPDLKNVPKDVKKIFHLDKIQSIISKRFSSFGVWLFPSLIMSFRILCHFEQQTFLLRKSLACSDQRLLPDSLYRTCFFWLMRNLLFS